MEIFSNTKQLHDSQLTIAVPGVENSNFSIKLSCTKMQQGVLKNIHKKQYEVKNNMKDNTVLCQISACTKDLIFWYQFCLSYDYEN